MSDIKLKAASGGGSISLKGPSTLGSDRDLVDTSGNINLLDNQKVKCGDSTDLQIYHSSSSGNNIYQGNSHQFWNGAGNEALAKFTADGSCELYHNSTKQCETSANGLAFPSGKGIDFSATSDATGKDNELFSDYEEGNWSPVIGATGGSVSVTYTTQKGWYVRSGRVVHLWFDCAWNSGSSQSGNLRLDGFPYTTSNNDDWKAQYVGPIMMTDVDVDGNAKTIVFHSWNNTTQGEFYATTDNASWTATGYDTAGRIIGQIQLLAGA
jgi:hypothetical protein